MEPAVSIRNLSKKYILTHQGSYQTLRDTISDGVKKIVRRENSVPKREAFWALRDLSLDIQPGERVGIIGRNGAGKSTLLKIISHITNPTTGEVKLRGRVASLLEVGTGFNPELTGRENIFLNGAILGMTRKEIQGKFDEIVAFSEIEKFLDTPVKRYSSGMYVRLAFSVAAHLDSDILIVDEVLAVGDAQFQKKSLGKMQDVAGQGRTVVFVSHNMAAIAQLCTRALWLEGGRVRLDDDVLTVTNGYVKNNYAIESGAKDLTDPGLRKNSNPESEFKWFKVTMADDSGKPSTAFALGQPIHIQLQGHLQKDTDNLRLGFSIHSSLGFPVFQTYQYDQGGTKTFRQGDHNFEVILQPNFLAPGYYDLNIEAHGPATNDMLPSALQFSVAESGLSQEHMWEHDRVGVVRLPIPWKELNH